MGLIDVISSLFTEKRLTGLDQLQNEAVVRLLALVVAADNHIGPEEEAELAEGLEPLEWKSHDHDLQRFSREALDDAHRVLETGQIAAYCEELADRIGEQWLQEETYFMAAHIATADAEIKEPERVVLQTLVEVFDIPERRLAHISDQLLRTTEF